MENFKFIRPNINREKKVISVQLSNSNNNNNNDNDTQEICIDVSFIDNDEYILHIIDMANRYYSVKLFEIGRSDTVEPYGCLTSKVLGLNGFPLTFMNAKYLINIFLKLLQCLYKDHTHYLQLFKRDENSIKIPTSEVNMSFLMKEVMKNCINDNDDDIDGDNVDIDIRNLLLIVLNYISNLSMQNAKKMNNSRIQKNIHIAGGVHNVQELFRNKNCNNNLQDNINETLHQTGDMIHKLLFDFREEIIKNKACEEDLENILKLINGNPNMYLYQNINVSFKFMMQFVSNVFNALFVDILPKTSMINCLYATLYQASALYELNILEPNSKFIQIPLLYRLIYSFYKCDYQPASMSTDDEMSSLVDKLCRSKDQQDLETICKIANKVNIQDTKQLNTLFWLLNDKRGYTYEFYLIIIISLFVMSKCQALNKINKMSNCKQFGQPLYDLLHKFYIYVVYELKDLNVALCGETLDNFSLLHGNVIKICLKNFLSNINFSPLVNN